MADLNPDPTAYDFRDDLVAYLAKRLGVPHEVALSTLGNWLVHFERTQVLLSEPGGSGEEESGQRR